MSDKSLFDGSEPATASLNQVSPGDARPEDFEVSPAIPVSGQRGDSPAEYRRLLAANKSNPLTGKSAPIGQADRELA